MRQPRSKDPADDPVANFKEKLDVVVEAQQDLDFCEKPFFRSAIWEATWKNHEDIVRLLADKGAKIDFADYQGRTPLHEAAYYGHCRIVEFLLDRGHPIDCQDTFGQTPLFRAVEAGRHAVIETLVSRQAKVGLVDKDQVTAQHIAGFGGKPRMSEWLVYHGAYKNRLALDEPIRPRSAVPGSADAAAARTPRKPPLPVLPAWQSASSLTDRSREVGSVGSTSTRPRSSSKMATASGL